MNKGGEAQILITVSFFEKLFTKSMSPYSDRVVFVIECPLLIFNEKLAKRFTAEVIGYQNHLVNYAQLIPIIYLFSTYC